MKSFSREDSQFLAYVRSLSILVIVFGHIGLFWVYEPYSEFLHVLIPVFFVISGAVSYGSYCRSDRLAIYYKKRCIGLLIPYYLLVILQFLLFIWVNKGITILSFSDVIRWLFIIPNNAIMPFSIGHVWFLHTLFVIILISPLYFYLFKKNKIYILLLICFSLFISFVQMFSDISSDMILLHNNLFKPLVHSCFFLFGMVVFHAGCCRQKKDLFFLLISSLLLSIILAKGLALNINYNVHVYAPDLFYVSGSFAAIAAILLSKQFIFRFIQIFCLKSVFSFLHRHTYSIYLVHVPVLALWFHWFALDKSSPKTISYGLLKMSFVVIGTFLSAVPFTFLSSLVCEKAYKFIQI